MHAVVQRAKKVGDYPPCGAWQTNFLSVWETMSSVVAAENEVEANGDRIM